VTIDTIFDASTDLSPGTIGFDVMGTEVPALKSVAIASPEPDCASAECIAERGTDAAGPWIAYCEQTGVIEIHDPRLLRPGHEAFCVALVKAAIARFGALRAEVRIDSATCRLEFEPGRFNRTELARRVSDAVRAATPAVRDGSASRDGSSSGWTILTGFTSAGQTLLAATRGDSTVESRSAKRPVATAAGSGRVANLVMAGASFALAVGGIILPEIPALPFLIMSARYAVRLCPGFEQRLMRQTWCATWLPKAEDLAGTTLDWRSSLPMIGLSALVALALLIIQPPYPVVIGLELGLMGLFGWHELGGQRFVGVAGGAAA
jgi:uncharacterized membrane protein YbaN (DUF454 family)